MARKVRVLSVDGGGLKGLIAIKILQAVERYTSAGVAGQFDLLAGTSTGGLIVCALATAAADDGAAYNLSQIENMYLEVGQEIFRQGGLSYVEQDVKIFDGLLAKTFGARKISETLRPVLVPTYSIDEHKLVIIKTRSAREQSSKDVLVTQVCRATTAIPPVFPTYRMKYDNRDLHCVDAGPYLKNPAISALAEVWKHKAFYGSPDLREEDIVLFSVSTGSYRHSAADWSTNINEVLHSQEMDMEYISTQGLQIDFSKVKYMRVDMNLGGSSFSLMQLLQWIDRIEALSGNSKFAKDVSSLLAE